MMDRHMSASLDRHITGNYGENQFKNIGSRPRKKMNKPKPEKQSTVPKKGKVK